MRSVVKGEWQMIRERWQVVFGKQKDPFDSFDWMDQLHQQFDLRPIYFFLISDKTGKYDKNISPLKEINETFDPETQ